MLFTHKLNMEISRTLNQYMNIYKDAFNEYTAKLNKSTKYVVMETLLLFMDISRKINFTTTGTLRQAVWTVLQADLLEGVWLGTV